MTRSRPGAPMAMVVCLSGLLGTVVACSGRIDDNQDVASSRPTTSDMSNGRSNGPANDPSPVGTSSGTDDTDRSDIRTREQSTDDLLGVSGASRATGAGRRGSGSRASNAENTADGGDVDAGEADAGEADAGEVDTDAGSIAADAGRDDGVAAPL